MNIVLKNFIRSYFAWFYRPLRAFLKDQKIKKDVCYLKQLIPKSNTPNRIFYLGITNHSNLGDMAQHYCIKRWIKKNYPEYELIMFESDTVVDEKYDFITVFKKVYRQKDIIVFQSGYTTQDMGGNHEYMHRLVVDTMPYANILMMPQTILYEHEENKVICSESLGKAQHMLFLARDFVSEETAKKMFPLQPVKAFPDIVTTLIGTFQFENKRSGICMCCRNDSEKYYSNVELNALKARLELIEPVTLTDTTIKASYKKIRKNLQKFIEGEIENFSRYKVVITDRYHGTIFAIAAGTPVVIIKTNDHKVTTGADWFKGIYDEYVNVATDLDDAFNIASAYLTNEKSHNMKPYFEENYYDKLKDYFEVIINK